MAEKHNYEMTEWNKMTKNKISGIIDGKYIVGRIINRNDDRTIDIEAGFNVYTKVLLVW